LKIIDTLAISIFLLISPLCDAEIVWPLHFNSTNSRTAISYQETIDKGALYINPRSNYLSAIEKSLPLPGGGDLISWTSPTITVSVQNSTQHEVIIDHVRFDVINSKLDNSPLPITSFSVDGYWVKNFGWGAMRSLRVEYIIRPDQDCQRSVDLDKGEFNSAAKTIYADSVASGAEKYVALSESDALRRQGYSSVCVFAIASYSDDDGIKYNVPFREIVLLFQPGPAAPPPPIEFYDIYLEAGKTGVTDIPIYERVGANAVGSFNLLPLSNQSATFVIFATSFSATGSVLGRETVFLHYVRPRNLEVDFRAAPRAYHEARIDFSGLAPYIRKVLVSPSREDDGVRLLISKDWVDLKDRDKAAFELTIEDQLAKLHRKRVRYCLISDIRSTCVAEGYFQYP
jgi:hypothetical protein